MVKRTGLRSKYIPDKLENVMVALQLRHDEVEVERSSGDDVDDVDRSSDELEPTWGHYEPDTRRASLGASPAMTSFTLTSSDITQTPTLGDYEPDAEFQTEPGVTHALRVEERPVRFRCLTRQHPTGHSV